MCQPSAVRRPLSRNRGHHSLCGATETGAGEGATTQGEGGGSDRGERLHKEEEAVVTEEDEEEGGEGISS